MSDMHLPPERENDQDFAAERDALQGGADLMLKLMSKRLELVCVTDQTGGILTLVPAGTEVGDGQRLDGLHQRVERIEATLDAGNGQPMANSAVMADMAANLARIADALTPKPADIVGSPYVANLLGCTTVWVAEMVRRGDIPKNCVVPGTGNGKPWKFYREKIDAWVKSR